MQSDKKKQSYDGILIGKAVKTCIQTFYHKGLLDNYDNANEVMEDFLLMEDNERRRPVLDALNGDDNVIH